MFEVKRRGRIGYEDLMREMEAFERQIMVVDSSLAMNLMVLEAKIRERFQQMERQNAPGGVFGDLLGDAEEDLSMDDIRGMIPQDIAVQFPPFQDLTAARRRKKILETVGLAALLAVATAFGVFTLAAGLQLGIHWLG